MEQWKIYKDRSPCDKPGCPLSQASEFFAVLELPECLRRDLCGPCFRELERAAVAKGSEPIFWRATRDKDGKRGLDLASLRRLFDALGEPSEQSEETAGLRYFVALLLLRKRMLKLVDATTPEQEAADLVVIDPKIEGATPIALCGPALTSERLGELKNELLSALD